MTAPVNAPADPKILIVDDEEQIRKSYAAVLKGAGYAVVMACDGLEALDMAQVDKPALILLDVDMPRANGWETLRLLHSRGCRQPVVMLTGCVAIEDRVRGLGEGADDYLCKPCDKRELIARVHAVLRRSQPRGPNLKVLTFGAVTVNLAERTAIRAGEPVGLTRTEYAIVELLASQAGRLVTREQMLEQIWGYGAASNTRTVDTHIWRLRQKLQDSAGEKGWIQTVSAGGGYRLVNEVLTPPPGAFAA